MTVNQAQLLTLFVTISAAMIGVSIALSTMAYRLSNNAVGHTRRKARLALKLGGMASLFFVFDLTMSLGFLVSSVEETMLNLLTYSLFIVGCVPLVSSLVLIYSCSEIKFHLRSPISVVDTEDA